MSNIAVFNNGYVCLRGTLYQKSIHFDVETGLIVNDPSRTVRECYDLEGLIIAPAYIELQTNGCTGFHFAQFKDLEGYKESLEKVSTYLATTGVGSFWATLPTVSSEVFKKVLPCLRPRTYQNGAELLGAHYEGPWLNPSKKGAHDASLMQSPSTSSVQDVYGIDDPGSIIKMITIAPELEKSLNIISSVTQDYGVVVSLGHSAAEYETGIAALNAGARALTHVFNAMNPLHHRDPGLVGTISSAEAPYYSIIPDGIHLQHSIVTIAFRTNPEKCILITDSIEMAGLPDGLYPGHSQIPHQQRNVGNKVTIEGTDTLIGSCISLDQCVKNLVRFTGCKLPEAIRCVTENIANMMGLRDRGVLETGRRADFAILNQAGDIQSVWIRGRKIFDSRTCAQSREMDRES